MTQWWLEQIAIRHDMPLLAVVQLYDGPGGRAALQGEIARLIAEGVRRQVARLLDEKRPALPDDDTIASRAVRGLYAQERVKQQQRQNADAERRMNQMVRR